MRVQGSVSEVVEEGKVKEEEVEEVSASEVKQKPRRDQIGRRAVWRATHLFITTIWYFEGRRLQRLWNGDTPVTPPLPTQGRDFPPMQRDAPGYWKLHLSVTVKHLFIHFYSHFSQKVLNVLLLLLLRLLLVRVHVAFPLPSLLQ